MSLIEGLKSSGLIAEDLPPPVRFGSWTDAVARSVLHFEFDCDRPGSFRGALSDRSLAGVAFIDMECGRHAAHRGPESISPRDAGYYILTLQLSGRFRLTQDGRTAVLTPGCFALYDSAKPASVVSSDDYKSTCIKFPRERVGAGPDTLAAITATAFECGPGLPSAVWSAVLGLNRELESLGASGPLAVRGMMELVTTLLASRLGRRPAVDRRAELRDRIREYIDAHLPDPGLTPGAIAAAHYISPRHLHQLFEQDEDTVAGCIRSRRIERCRRDLADPRQAEVPVSAVAARWGFADASHFGQVFKRHTGQTPAEFRRTAARHPAQP
ncbi:helix-turn-helix domain-containing protein [Streptomonospora sp. PA3]|uniref:AraC-like ligand-binding domain-containing protein n=1 Tax=Streptomonospora sp. PA3 TaxID=2607326 RepID=UPI001CA41E1B